MKPCCALQEVNAHGVDRICKMLAVLQPALSALGASTGLFRPEASRLFEKARVYYNLLKLSVEELIAHIEKHPKAYLPDDYMALLQVG